MKVLKSTGGSCYYCPWWTRRKATCSIISTLKKIEQARIKNKYMQSKNVTTGRSVHNLLAYSPEPQLCRHSGWSTVLCCWHPKHLWSHKSGPPPLLHLPVPPPVHEHEFLCTSVCPVCLMQCEHGFPCVWIKISCYHDNVVLLSRPVQRLFQIKPPILWNTNVLPTFSTQPEVINMWICHLKLRSERSRREKSGHFDHKKQVCSSLLEFHLISEKKVVTF